MEIPILSAIISASVAILIAILNYFVITPIKEKKERMREQIKNLYAPLYGITCARLSIVFEHSIKTNKIMLGSHDFMKYTHRAYMEEFLLNHSGYATNNLLSSGLSYISNVDDYDEKTTFLFVTTMVKDFNRLKKKVGMEYNEEELNTGIPECIKELREVYKDKQFE